MRFLAVVLLAFSAACASSGPKLEAGPPRAPSEEEASRIMTHARALREAKGCQSAAPALRVVAAMGEGFEPAQHELGECLITMTGTSEAETALLRSEGHFWLTRAAWAGNPRAQRTLTTRYGAPNGPRADKLEALKWALVYAANKEADLYGFKALPATFIPGLKNALSTDEVAAAENFAAAFKPLHLTPYNAPPRERAQRSENRPGGFGDGGARRRR